MADVQPLRALHYNLEKTAGLQPVVSPPYDVIDAEMRNALAARSPYNVVAIDMPVSPNGGDVYAHAAEVISNWRDAGVLLTDTESAIWPIEQRYSSPDGQEHVRRGFLGRVRVEEYGAGRIRPHERTHPGPKDDRLRLTRATRINVSPIFALYSDPAGRAWQALMPATKLPPWGESTDATGTVNRLWRVTSPEAITAVQAAVADAELLIADGHHRYETARTYAQEVGGQGPHNYVLTCLVALEDPGLAVFPTHRLLSKLSEIQWQALQAEIERDFEVTPLESVEQLAPAQNDRVELGYLDTRRQQPLRLRLKHPAAADAALGEHSDAYRRLDTAVTEALLLKGALQMSDQQINRFEGLWYARDSAEAIQLVLSGQHDVALFMAPTPVARVQEVAAAGESMPPKSTFFFPKVPTGLLFNPLA